MQKENADNTTAFFGIFKNELFLLKETSDENQFNNLVCWICLGMEVG